MIRRFAELRLERNLDALLARADTMDATDRALVAMDLADLLEKYLDRGVLYFGQNRWITEFASSRAGELSKLAGAVGQPVLGEALMLAIEAVRGAEVADVLRAPVDRKYLYGMPPLSHRRKLIVALRQWPKGRFYPWIAKPARRLLGRRR